MFFYLCLYDWSDEERQAFDEGTVYYIMQMSLRSLDIWRILFSEVGVKAL